MVISVENKYSKIDPRQLAVFMKNPSFIQSLSSEQLSGMERRIYTAKWTSNERLVYAAIQEGYTDMDSLPVATGLTTRQIDTAISSLSSRGIVSKIEGKEEAI